LNWANSSWTNPYSNLLKISKITTSNLNANLVLDYQLIAGLSIHSNFGGNRINSSNTIFTPLSSFNPAVLTAQANAQYGTSSTNSWIIEPQLNYALQMGKNQLKALVGSSFFNQTQNSVAQTGTGFSSDALLENIRAAASIRVDGVGYALYRYTSIFGRLNYSYDDKYLMNLTARRDGSSRFGPGRQFGNFGALGLGWIFSKEKFVQRLPVLSFGKLRASYGITGNDQIGDYNFYNTYAPYSFSYQGIKPLIPTKLNNSDFAWEINKKLEAALDLGFFQDRILLSTAWYRNRSSNQLLPYTLPLTTGFTQIVANLPATVQNTGWEFTLNTINIKTKDFSWTSSANLTIPRNKLIAYPDLVNSPYAQSFIIGQSLFFARVYHATGVNKQTGLFDFLDVDKDGSISNPEDVQTVVFTGQQFYGGLQNNFRYKNWTLDLFVQYTQQKNRPNYYGIYTLMPGRIFNQPEYVLNRWKNDGDQANFQKFSNANSAASVAFARSLGSDHIYSDASYFRVKNISISYELPANIKHRLQLQNLRFYIQAQNLLTISNYFGADPESQAILPPIKLVTVGIQVTI
jgi:TonB-linked SusC/RagA family outer membrane protein